MDYNRTRQKIGFNWFYNFRFILEVSGGQIGNLRGHRGGEIRSLIAYGYLIFSPCSLWLGFDNTPYFREGFFIKILTYRPTIDDESGLLFASGALDLSPTGER
jgi:hypothetical protein